MADESNILRLIDRDMSPVNAAKNTLYPSMHCKPFDVAGLGIKAESERLELIAGLIKRRKTICDITIDKLEDLIIYCDNKIIAIGDEDIIRGDLARQQMASPWQKTIMELEKQKIIEHKEHFRDTLFLQNEQIKSMLTYREEKRLDDLMINMVSK